MNPENIRFCFCIVFPYINKYLLLFQKEQSIAARSKKPPTRQIMEKPAEINVTVFSSKKYDVKMLSSAIENSSSRFSPSKVSVDFLLERLSATTVRMVQPGTY